MPMNPRTARTRKVRKPKPAPSMVPHAAVVMSVDTAELSGWAITVCGKLVAYGEIDMLENVKAAIAACAESVRFGADRLPVVMVYEKPFGGTNQGAYVGAWKMAWRAAGGVAKRVVGVYPSTWRARVLGHGAVGAKREQVRAMEVRAASVIAGRVTGPDESPAIMIGQWGARCGEVREKLPRRKSVSS